MENSKYPISKENKGKINLLHLGLMLKSSDTSSTLSVYFDDELSGFLLIRKSVYKNLIFQKIDNHLYNKFLEKCIENMYHIINLISL